MLGIFSPMHWHWIWQTRQRLGGLRLPSLVGLGNDYSHIEQELRASAFGPDDYHLGVSIVIPVYNQREILGKTLAGLSHQTYPDHLMEVVIADDGSSDGVEESLEAWRQELSIQYVWQEDQGYRLSAVRNRGIRAASHNHVIILDCDMLPVPELVEAFMQYLHVTSKAVLIGGRKFVDTSSVTAGQIRRDIRAALDLPEISPNNNELKNDSRKGPLKDWREQVYRQTRMLKRHAAPFTSFVGCNVACPKEIFDQVGWFDEEFRAWGCEDQEMGYRIYNAGYYFIPVPQAVALHQEPPSASEIDRSAGRKLTAPLMVDKCPHSHYRPIYSGKHSVPKISIYIPAYNVAAYIREAVGSALSQTVTDLEVVIVDDGSTDDTLQVVEQHFGDDPRVRWFTSQHAGIAAASNLALNKCRGQFIGQLDGDDRLKPHAVKTLLPHLDAGEYEYVYGLCEYINADGSFLKPYHATPPFNRELTLLGMIAPHFRMFSKRAWSRTGGFDERLSSAVDYDMFLKLSEVARCLHVGKVLYEYRWHGENTSIVSLKQQSDNAVVAVERALSRNGLADGWQVVVPGDDPQLRVLRPVSKRKAGSVQRAA